MKVVVVGAGYWGKNLVRTFHELNALGAIAESDPTRRASLAVEYPTVPVVASLLEAKSLGVTAAAIATPVVTHSAVTKIALELGLDVFLEKPMTLSVADAEELVTLAEAKNRLLMVGHLLLYQPAIRWISNFLREGGLGQVYSLHQERLNLGKARSVENAVWSLGVHDIAVLLDLVGQSPTQVQVTGQAALQSKVEDDIYVHLKFPGSIQAHLHCSWLWPERSRRLTIVGEKGMLVFDEIAQTVTLHKKRIANDLSQSDEGSEIVFKQSAQPLTLELQHFLDRVQDRRPPLSHGRSALEVIKVLAATDKLLASKESRMQQPTTPPHYKAHASAYIDDGAVVGKDTRIWHFSHVSSGSTIGDGCSLGQNVFVAKNVTIGNHVKIQNNVSLYEGVVLEDYVFCGPSMVFTNVRTPRSAFPRNTSADYHTTRVEYGASIGANATIVCGTSIGRWAFVAAGAVVTKNVPAHALMAGVPARVIGWVCECGHTLKFQDSEATCDDCGRHYRKTAPDKVEKSSTEKGTPNAHSHTRSVERDSGTLERIQ